MVYIHNKQRRFFSTRRILRSRSKYTDSVK